MTQDAVVRAAYDAYNRRDLEAGLAQLHSSVRWDDGEGRMLQGHHAVGRHWQDEWRTADAQVAILSIRHDDARLRLSIVLRTRPAGGPSAQRELGNEIAFLDGLIAVMRIRPGPP